MSQYFKQGKKMPKAQLQLQLQSMEWPGHSLQNLVDSTASFNDLIQSFTDYGDCPSTETETQDFRDHLAKTMQKTKDARLNRRLTE